MKRIVVLMIGVLLALVMAAPMVSAQGQGGAPEDVDGSIDLPIPEAPYASCEFPVRFEFSGKSKTITLPDETTLITSPKLKATLTNLDNPENQETFSITGATRTKTLENGDVQTMVTGRNLLGDPEAGFVIADGRFSFVFDKDGNLVQPLTGNGKLIDVCERLA
jgi:hypothetical protein